VFAGTSRRATKENSLWRVELRGLGRFTARWLIDATGRVAAVSRKLLFYNVNTVAADLHGSIVVIGGENTASSAISGADQGL
jgi:hypothetical protein